VIPFNILVTCYLLQAYAIAIITIVHPEWLLTTSSLITAISTVSSPITTVRKLDALSIAAQECSTAASG